MTDSKWLFAEMVAAPWLWQVIDMINLITFIIYIYLFSLRLDYLHVFVCGLYNTASDVRVSKWK